MYLWMDEPDETTIAPQPYGLGLACFPTPLSGGGGLEPAVVWNNLGRPIRLGEATRGSAAAPTVLFDIGRYGFAPRKFTIQGFIEDDDSSAAGPLSLTNAVTVKVE